MSEETLDQRIARQKRERLDNNDDHDKPMFAGMALMGLCSKQPMGNAKDIADTAWKVADEMCAARRRREGLK